MSVNYIMFTQTVKVPNGSYKVIIEKKCLKDLVKSLKKIGLTDKKCAVITDTNVAKHYSSIVKELLSEGGVEYSYHVFEAGEHSKSMKVAEEVTEEMIKEGHDRHSFVLALGGGVTGDLSGFISSIFYRGIPYVQIPTTIVSQVDSSVGGKTGVNSVQGKNLIGSFHQPSLVMIDPELLETLPKREYLEGYAEVIKHACIMDKEMLDLLEEMDLEKPVSAELLKRNIDVKAKVVEQDEKETSGIRAILNFGHTIGHGIEAAVPYGELLHGEAIAIGIRAALFLSVKYNGLSQEDANRILVLLYKFSLPTHLPENVDSKVVIEKMAKDKKFSKGKMHFVLLKSLGEAEVVDNLKKEQVEEVLKHIETPLEFVTEEVEYSPEDLSFIRFVGGPLSTNGYLINTGQQCIAIDAPEGFYSILEERNIEVAALFLTHQHFDHVADAHVFAEAGVPIYSHSDFSESLLVKEIGTKWGIDVNVKPYKVDHLLKSKEIVKIGDSSVCIIPLPGHSEDSVGLYFPGKLLLFSGDTLLKGSIGRTDIKGGDSPLLTTTIKERLLNLSGAVQVFPGHGDETTIERERYKNPFLDGEKIKNEARIIATGGPNLDAMKVDNIAYEH